MNEGVGLAVEVEAEVDVDLRVGVCEAVEVEVSVVVDVGVKEFGLGATSLATIPKQYKGMVARIVSTRIPCKRPRLDNEENTSV